MPPSTPADRPAAGRPAPAAAKTALRRAVYDRRRQRYRTDPQSIRAAGDAVCDLLLRAPEISTLAPGSVVAAYAELPTEVPVTALRRALVGHGLTVLLPVLLPDGDLDWAPAGQPVRGPAAVTGVSAILLPGVAGDEAGHRLGRGGGSYDRALGRLPARAVARVGSGPRVGSAPQAGREPAPARPWTCLVLFAEEVVAEVPVAAHDATVDAIVTPAGLLRTAGLLGAAPAGAATTIGTRQR